MTNVGWKLDRTVRVLLKQLNKYFFGIDSFSVHVRARMHARDEEGHLTLLFCWYIRRLVVLSLGQEHFALGEELGERHLASLESLKY